jgi:signal peptidase I
MSNEKNLNRIMESAFRGAFQIHWAQRANHDKGMTKVWQTYQLPRRHVWLAFAGVALIAAALIFQARFRVTIVLGDSMLPTLASGDLLLVDKNAYKTTEPHRGDIVVARNASSLIVKRIVGLPGEEVEVRKGTVYVNNAASQENYGRMEGLLNVEKGRLMAGDFASLGDNRAIPEVLAIHPILSKPDILGKVVWARCVP